MGICLRCSMAEHGECRCAEIDYEIAFKDGWNACREEAAKLVEHWNKTMWSHEQLIEEIRALKPAKGESKRDLKDLTPLDKIQGIWKDKLAGEK